MKRRAVLAALGTGGIAGLAGCSSALGLTDDSPCSGDECDIGMNRNAFLPDRHEVSAGESVVWKNTSSADHTVTAYEDRIPADAAYFATGGYDSEQTARDEWFDSLGGGLGPGETFEHTFDIPGRYTYVCIPHEQAGMVGTIEVSE